MPGMTSWLSLLTEDFGDSVRRQRFARPIATPIQRLRWLLFLHTGILQNIRPFPTGTSMAVLKMLAEVVGAEEFLSVIAFAEFVYCCQMVEPAVPIGLGEIGKFFAAITTRVVR